MKNLIILCLVVWAIAYFYKDAQRVYYNLNGSISDVGSFIKQKLQ